MSTVIKSPALPVRKAENNPVAVIKKCQKMGKPVYIAGPMVRYSKLPFRQTMRHYNVDIIYTPMILAREFVRNANARMSDFSTNEFDTPLILQVGVNNVTDLMRMVEMVTPYVDGIGLNCGCPIKEQVREGIGAALMTKPDLVSSMVRAVKEKYGDTICIETKIRVHDDVQETIEFAKKVEEAGVDFITVHGRTRTTRSSVPVNLEKIRKVKEAVNVPVIANGDCFQYSDIDKIISETGCDGVMAVRGILENPALFANYDKCPWSAIEWFWHYATSYGLPFRLTQHHLACMLEGLIERRVLIELNETESLIKLLQFFDTHFYLKRFGEEGFATKIDVPFK